MLFILVSFCNISHNLFEEVQNLKTLLMMNVQMKTQEIDSSNELSSQNPDFRKINSIHSVSESRFSNIHGLN